MRKRQTDIPLIVIALLIFDRYNVFENCNGILEEIIYTRNLWYCEIKIYLYLYRKLSQLILSRQNILCEKGHPLIGDSNQWQVEESNNKTYFSAL
jgi:hypothetical protein